MKLSENFTLAELTRSAKADALKIDNTAPQPVIDNLRRLASLLEAVRAILGKPIAISSGYRSPALNKAISGKEASQHRLGCAADFVVSGMTTKQIMELLVDNTTVQYDQLIQEGLGAEWIHISVANSTTAKPRRQALVIDKNGVRPYV